MQSCNVKTLHLHFFGSINQWSQSYNEVNQPPCLSRNFMTMHFCNLPSLLNILRMVGMSHTIVQKTHGWCNCQKENFVRTAGNSGAALGYLASPPPESLPIPFAHPLYNESILRENFPPNLPRTSPAFFSPPFPASRQDKSKKYPSP